MGHQKNINLPFAALLVMSGMSGNVMISVMSHAEGKTIPLLETPN